MQALVKMALPSHFIGSEKLNPAMISSFKAYISKPSDQKDLVKAVFKNHQDALIPVAKELRDFIINENTAPIITTRHAICAQFVEELSMNLEQKNITPLWLNMIHIRYLIATSKITEEELNLFKHFRYPTLLSGLLNSHVHTTPFEYLLSLATENAFKESGSNQSLYYPKAVSYDLEGKIEEELRKLGMFNCSLPTLGIGKVGISFLIQCYLNNISIIGIPSQKDRLMAHGVSMGPGTFALHDIEHLLVDSRMDILKSYILKLIDEFVNKGGEAEQAKEFYTKVATHKHLKLMHTMSVIQHLFMRYLLATKDTKAYKKAMVGFFYLTHEYPSYSLDMYDNNDLCSLISASADYTTRVLYDSQMWESSEDPLATSPINGSSMLGRDEEDSKDKIARYAFDNFLLKIEHVPLLPKDREKLLTLPADQHENFRRKKITALIKEIDIKFSSLFIDVKFIMKDATEHRFNFPTLKFKWSNLDDTLSLLRAAGVVIKKPDLNKLSYQESREVAQRTLDRARAEIINCIDYFKQMALSLASMKDSSDLSLADRYFNSHFNLEKDIKQQTKRAIKHERQRTPKYRFF